ncbi:MAG TPA: fused MFS/spermidine synthase [Verrucomicrobiae bacterium]|nr:fused MFS/spermidine synthase [Verrucomicrobiae bacterium]
MELIFGTTTFAVATVLAAFMGGLACGSFFIGRLLGASATGGLWKRAASLHPLRFYALLECLIAAVALLIPALLEGLVPVYQAVWKATHASFITFSLVRFALSALILLVPTFLMGATLPVVSRFVSSGVRGQARIGLLYSFNTLGAVAGCAGAGLLLFPSIGLARTQWIGVALNLLAAAGAFVLSKRVVGGDSDGQAGLDTVNTPGSADLSPANAAAETGATTDAAVPIVRTTLATDPTARVWLVAAYAVSGFAAMLYEVAWSRVLVLVLGSSTYAYTIMLTTFLLGLALGAWMASRWLRPDHNALWSAALCQLGIALTTYASALLVAETPFLYLKVYEVFNPSARGLLTVQFVLAVSLMILPTLGLGAMFPITIRGLNPAGNQAAKVVGWAYALNTMGAIAGSVLAGFCFIPFLGSQNTFIVGILLNALAGAALLWQVREGALARLRPLLAGTVIVLGVVLCLAMPRWDPAVMSSGVFRYVRDYLGLSRDGFQERARKVSGEVLLFDEGLTCTVTVFRNPECLSLLVNGKPDASTPSGLANPFDTNAPALLLDLPTQILLGQLPMLLAPKQDETLVIGLGSGLTLGSVLTHPVQRVECIELEDAVVQGSRFFEEFNGRPLTDPRAALVVNDARNHLLVTDRKYDVIISEPSNPWIPGAANLFTREFFEVSRRKLQPDGLFCQWIQIYELHPDHFQSILRTFSSVFPEVHLFRVNHDAILIGSANPLPMVPREVLARFTPAVRRDLERIHIRTVEDLLARYWVGGGEAKQGLDRFPLNTDDNMLIEFAAPLQLLTGPTSGKTARPAIAQLFAGRTHGAVPQVKLTEPAKAAEFWADVARAALRERMPETLIYSAHSLELAPNANAAAVQGTAWLMQGQVEPARQLLEGMEQKFPDAPELQQSLAQVYSFLKQWATAQKHAERWTRAAPNDPLGWFHLGRASFYLNDNAASLEAFSRIPPTTRPVEELKDLPFYLGALQAQSGNYHAAAENFRAFLRREPAHLEARVQLAEALYRAGHAPEAAVQWQKVAQLNSHKASELQSEAASDWAAGRREQAVSKLEQARALDPANADIALMLARVRVLTGRLDEAADGLGQYLAANPDRAQVVGYLGQLCASQKRFDEAKTLAARYRALTGTVWEDVRD